MFLFFVESVPNKRVSIVVKMINSIKVRELFKNHIKEEKRLRRDSF